MKTILNVTLSASGKLSEVKARLLDQAQAAAPADPQTVGAVKSYLEKALEGVSEDDTLTVRANITASVAKEPDIVTAERQAQLDAIAAKDLRLAQAAKREEELTAQLAEARAALEAAKVPAAPLPVSVTAS
jgi:hypothetical protein